MKKMPTKVRMFSKEKLISSEKKVKMVWGCHKKKGRRGRDRNHPTPNIE